MSTEKFNELGLTFKTLTPSDFDEISKFQMLYFFPDEPIARSTKLLEGSGIINKYISSLVKKHMIDPCLKDEVSVAAYNKDGEIIGVRYMQISKLTEILLKTIVRAATACKAPKAWALPRFCVSICSYKNQPVKKKLR